MRELFELINEYPFISIFITIILIYFSIFILDIIKMILESIIKIAKK